MKFFATLAALTAVASAAPLEVRGQDWNNCPTRAYVEQLVANFATYLSHTDLVAARAAAEATFDDNIQEFSDSVNSLRGAPLGTQVESMKQVYINETLSTPPIPEIDTTSLTIDCAQAVWGWKFYGPATPANPWVSGYTLFKINDAGLVYYQHVEFNSLDFANASGFTITRPASGPFALPPA